MSKTVTFVIDPLDPAKKEYPIRLVDGIGPGGTVLESSVLPESLMLPGQTLDPFGFAAIVQEKRKDGFSAAGQHLWALLNVAEVGARYQALRAAHADLRTRIHVRPEKVACLPWELLDEHFVSLFLDHERPIVRCHASAAALVDRPQTWPLRALVVVGSAVEDIALRAEQEIRAVVDASAAAEHALDIEVLRRPPTIDALRDAIRAHRPHLFHFIGHGALRRGEGILIFENDAADDPWILQAREIPNELLTLEWKPHLVLLNACRSSDRGLEKEAAWSMSQAFARAGARAVLAMQADIGGQAAATLSSELYFRLSSGVGIDAAVARARARILGDEHPIPTLSLACAAERVLPMRPRVSGDAVVALERGFPEVREFVDRRQLRRQALAAFHPFRPGQKEQHLLVIVGEARAGKTWMARWCMHACARQDYRVREVKIVDDRGKNWLELLRLIRDGDPSTRQIKHEALDPRAFDRFNWDLNARLAGGRHRPWNQERVPSDDYTDATDLKDFSPQDIHATLDSFREALKLAARDKPTLLVLDDFSVQDQGSLVASEFKEYLRAGLIDPIAEGKVDNVKMVLIVSGEERRELGLHEGFPKLETVEVGGLPRDRFRELAIDYLYRAEVVATDEDRDDLEGTINLYQRWSKLPDPWKIDKLEALQTWLRNIASMPS